MSDNGEEYVKITIEVEDSKSVRTYTAKRVSHFEFGVRPSFDEDIPLYSGKYISVRSAVDMNFNFVAHQDLYGNDHFYTVQVEDKPNENQ